MKLKKFLSSQLGVENQNRFWIKAVLILIFFILAAGYESLTRYNNMQYHNPSYEGYKKLKINVMIKVKPNWT